ncbi:MAG: hypothetical protein V5804_10540 [Mucilaginibacter sp.]|uniref:hypothetical protein n=1 Tax=Mucilaginibacter sp. TaxID=1882438 RepID=UPI0034E5EA1A
MNKKDFPLIILESLQSFVDLKGNAFNVINPEDKLLKIIDSDEKSSFYFNIDKYEKQQSGIHKILLDKKPISKTNTQNQQFWIEVKDLQPHFNAWLELLNSYNKVKSFFDDPIINSYTESYFSEFELVDEDANSNPLTPRQILLLDEHLEYIENNIENYQNESNASQIQEIKNDIIELRENLTNKSKAWIVKNLSKSWAKLTKQGTRFLKDFLNEAKKQVIVESIKYAITHGQDLIS